MELDEYVCIGTTQDAVQTPGSAGVSVLEARRTAGAVLLDGPAPLSVPVVELNAAPTAAKGVSQGLLLCRCLGSSASGSAWRTTACA